MRRAELADIVHISGGVLSRAGSALLFAIALAATACGSSTSTNLTNPSNPRCQPSVTGSASAFGPSGGTGSVSIGVSRECSWTVTSSASWIAVTGQREGQGDATVGFQVSENADPLSRRGSIGVGEQQVQLSQDGAPCRFDVRGPHDLVSGDGGDVTVDVRAHSACSWTAASDAPWASRYRIALTSP